MDCKTLPIKLLVLVILLLVNANAGGQPTNRLGETWKGSNSSLLPNILKNRANKPTTGTTKPRVEVLKFNPAGDSGVAKSLADAFGSTPAEKAALTAAFVQIKQAFDAEAGSHGKGNNIAAAMTFFITANVTVYHQTDMPSDEMIDSLFEFVQAAMATLPEFARVSNSEKQQMHDWLVCFAGLVLAGYTDAKQNGNQDGVKNSRQLAKYAMRLVLGADIEKLSFSGGGLEMTTGNASSPTAGPTENKLAGVWSKSGSSPMGSPGSVNLVTNAGYYKTHIASNGKARQGFAETRINIH